MDEKYPIELMDAKIRDLRRTAEEILVIGESIEAVKRNTLRVLASTKMLQLTVCDVQEILREQVD
jgi:hypothetical protein